jgi:hypothetical protein
MEFARGNMCQLHRGRMIVIATIQTNWIAGSKSPVVVFAALVFRGNMFVHYHLLSILDDLVNFVELGLVLQRVADERVGIGFEEVELAVGVGHPFALEWLQDDRIRIADELTDRVMEFADTARVIEPFDRDGLGLRICDDWNAAKSGIAEAPLVALVSGQSVGFEKFAEPLGRDALSLCGVRHRRAAPHVTDCRFDLGI